MFTGIVEEIGEIVTLVPTGTGFTITISAKKILVDTKLGDSISVNGVCLTVVNIKSTFFSVVAVQETVEKTNLSALKPKNKVNLERALRADSRLGGHFVQGHIDGVGTLVTKVSQNPGYLLTIQCDSNILKYIIPKGSIAVNGTSLTVVSKGARTFSVAIIPHTMENTILRDLVQGALVNLEVDILGKYAYEFFQAANNSGITENKLANLGYN